jgi:hypothetical protein
MLENVRGNIIVTGKIAVCFVFVVVVIILPSHDTIRQIYFSLIIYRRLRSALFLVTVGPYNRNFFFAVLFCLFSSLIFKTHQNGLFINLLLLF